MLYSVRKSNPESSLFPTVAGHQLQIASAASFFMTLGQGSPPNISGATVTEHEFCPTQSCKNKKSCISICKTRKICHGRKTKGKEVNQALENK
jgi:hypothetical protein